MMGWGPHLSTPACPGGTPTLNLPPGSQDQISGSEQGLGSQGLGSQGHRELEEEAPPHTDWEPLLELEHHGSGELGMECQGQSTASGSDSLTSLTLLGSLEFLSLILFPVFCFQKSPAPRGVWEVQPGSWGAPWLCSSS